MEELELTDSVETDKYALMEGITWSKGGIKPFLNRSKNKMLVILATIIGSITLLYLFPNMTMLFSIVIFVFAVRWLVFNNKYYE